jgi:hypothetical protein
MKVDVVRAAMFYATCTLFYEGYLLVSSQPHEFKIASWYLVTVCVLVLAISLTEMPRRIRKVVRTECFFIIAAARIRDDLNLSRTPDHP